MSNGELREGDVPLSKEASLVLYLVSPDYALRAGAPYEFELDRQAMEARGCHVFFASAVEIGENLYSTVGTSRAVALVTTAPDARERARDVSSTAPGRWRGSSGAGTWATRAI